MSLIIDSLHSWFFCDATRIPIQIDSMKPDGKFTFYIPCDGSPKGLEVVFHYDSIKNELKGKYTMKKSELSATFTAKISNSGKLIEVLPKGFCNREQWLFKRDDADCDETT